MNKNNLVLGKTKIQITDYASQGNAILGIRDSGKSYTATLIAERLMDAGIPFVAFDPIGIWKYLRVPGKAHGYPVVVAGGENGDLPLTPQSAPEIVRAAMQQGIPLVLDLYDIAMSKSDWKSIVEQSVRLLLYENKKHGLRHIFIEEAAEFVPQRVGPDQGRVYAEIEKLARMGGNALLGYTLINQRAEEVNKAVLELCDRLFLHRQKGRNSLIALSKWLDVGSSSAVKPIIDTMPTLPQGECWLWDSGSSQPEHIKIPQKNTFHPDRRATRSTDGKQDFKALDVTSFVSQMTSTLQVHLEKAKANDPKQLQKRIHELEMELKRQHPEVEIREIMVMTPQDTDNVSNIIEEANKTIADLREIGNLAVEAAERIRVGLDPLVTAIHSVTKAEKNPPVTNKPYRSQSLDQLRDWVQPLKPQKKEVSRPPMWQGDEIVEIPRPVGNILDALANLRWIGITQPLRTMVAFLANQSPRSSGFKNNLGFLRSQGMIEYVGSDRMEATEKGINAGLKSGKPLTVEEFRNAVFLMLPNPQSRILEPLVGASGKPMYRSVVAEFAGQSPNSSGFKNNLGALRSLGLIEYAGSEMVKAMPIMFLED